MLRIFIPFALGMGLASVNGINHSGGPLDLLGGVLVAVAIWRGWDLIAGRGYYARSADDEAGR